MYKLKFNHIKIGKIECIYGVEIEERGRKNIYS